MRRPLAALSLALLLLAGVFSARAAEDATLIAGLDDMTPGDQFRQLSLMLMVTDGADRALIEALRARQRGMEDNAAEGPAPAFDFDQYTTPLIRIVDQESMLAGATRLFQFTRSHSATIAHRLGQLRETHAQSIDRGLEVAIAEDAIIIRNAIADSIDYATLEDGDVTGRLSEDYRARTIYLRNNLEYELFSVELDRITRDAVASVGGKTDAYERMFDEEVDAAALDRKIRAAEYAYGWDREFDERAARMAEEILKNIWDEEIELDP